MTGNPEVIGYGRPGHAVFGLREFGAGQSLPAARSCFLTAR